jgi:hypothetical protein
MFRIDDEKGNGARLSSDAKLSPDDFLAIARRLVSEPFRARKAGLVAAHVAEHEQRVETRWNGRETMNSARPGDWIVTNLDANCTPIIDREGNRNIYVVAASVFDTLYEPAGAASSAGVTYRARSTVRAIALPGGFEIVAPWGEVQRADKGYLVLNGAEVYGNNAETFDQTYVVVPA